MDIKDVKVGSVIVASCTMKVPEYSMNSISNGWNFVFVNQGDRFKVTRRFDMGVIASNVITSQNVLLMYSEMSNFEEYKAQKWDSPVKISGWTVEVSGSFTNDKPSIRLFLDIGNGERVYVNVSDELKDKILPSYDNLVKNAVEGLICKIVKKE